MTRSVRLYVSLVSLAGLGLLAALGVAGGDMMLHDRSAGLWLLFAAVVIGEQIPIRLGPGNGEAAPSSTFTFALLLSCGIPAAACAQALACAMADTVVDRKPLSRGAFNVSQYTLAVCAAGAVLALTGVGTHMDSFGAADAPGIVLAGIVFYAVNTGLVAIVIALTGTIRLREQFQSDFIRQSATEGILLSLAPLAVLALEHAPTLLPLLALPMIAVHRAGRQALIAERLALHDALTGLPNRVLFRTRTRQALHAAQRVGAGVAVMLMDLDHFKEINDTLGHHYGDEVLRQVGERLKATLGARDTVSRLGGDEFAVLVPEVPTPAHGVAIASAIRAAIARPFDVAGVRLELGASVGIATAPKHGWDVDVLMQRADVAMYQAKEGKTGVEHYLPELDGNSVQRLALAGDLRAALEREQFVLHYQPKVDLRTGAVAGAEVLVRWAHPGHGSLLPDEFIPLAEHTGVIVPLSIYVLDHALRQAGAWREQGLDFGVAVNLSARTLIERELPDQIEDMCRRWKVPTRRLTLEITESMVVADPARTLPILARLHELGVEISIDDFGTGYSSMEYLKRLPVSEVKIDRSFVMPMATDARDAAIVLCTVNLARSLGLRVVAEGVETVEVQHRLRAMGCDQAQGFGFSRALPADEFGAWVVDRSRTELVLSA
jgi:diguanylate cyclase (GGDEF)-like protein